jgi:hypothetical protein
VKREVHSVAGLPVQFAHDIYRTDRVRLMVRTDAGLVGARSRKVPARLTAAPPTIAG